MAQRNIMTVVLKVFLTDVVILQQTTELLRSQLYSVVDRIQVAAQLNEDSAFLLWNVSSKNYEVGTEWLL